MAKQQHSEVKPMPNDCFVIMPIADHDGYDKGHFTKVYEDIFKPACISAGFTAVRADDVGQTNLIHLDILQKLIDSPMAICDLSAKNPNVLFELGLRQAFDKPTVLVQESGSSKIFDIAPLRYTEYRRELRYREVLEDQRSISEALKATKDATDRGEGINSIVRILSLSKPASLKEVGDDDYAGLLQLVRAEMSAMRSDFRRAMYMLERDRGDVHLSSNRIKSIRSIIREVEMLLSSDGPKEVALEQIARAQKRIANMLESDTSLEFRNEAKEMYMICEQLEHRIINQSKSL
ncbi:hypothetical protein [Chitinimonas koreensis]|uniref:hypothetical protein n=1 Tax=Chitinimonas koreensis TaxID=356302 RepID=UPI00041697D4|nr:hypothetical protein [Chitinimonas koreensis]QNM98826.1 hypothetical protein H9L41_11810 [Chitinimonas koreensis]